jgi:DNA-binding HxlR family transcriptional regulator
MNYQRAMMAGQIDKMQIDATAQRLKCVIASLETLGVINPFAPLIELPQNIPHPRKTLLLLLDFINVVTFFHQAQRERVVNEQTGEIYIKTAPEDIELAFKLLKTSLLRKADDLSTSGRGFLSWLKKHLQEAKTKQFTALDIRKTKTIHPRTLNRYLQELSLFHYIQITGGNKHRGGFIYKLTELNELTTLQNSIETSIKNTLQQVQGIALKKVNNEPNNEPPTNEPPINEPLNGNENEQKEPTFFEKNYKRIRINDKEEHTYKLILELEAKEPNREYLTDDITALSKRSQCIEARYLKNLWEQGKLTREWKNRQYHYRLSTPTSQTLSQNTLSNS